MTLSMQLAGPRALSLPIRVCNAGLPQSRRRPGRQRGNTLVEVLVALLLLAVGGLGAGALAMSAVRAARQSSLASFALQLAAGAGEAMRTRASQSDAANPFLQLDYDALADGPPAPAADCSAMPCDSAALANAELDRLRLLVFSRLPFGRIKICRDSASWDPATLSLRWDCDGAANAPAVVKIGWRQPRSAGDGEGGAAGGAAVLVAVPLGAIAAATP
jgi:type IV pilus assembly protein PilV